MSQLGEAVMTFQFVDNEGEACPFSHDKPPKVMLYNAFKGTGTALAGCMKRSESTFMWCDPTLQKAGRYRVEPSMRKPRDIEDHPFHKNRQPAISLEFDQVYRYRVSCAAHHLIPAQGSLKRSGLTDYMIQSGNPGEFQGAAPTTKKGKVWCNVGYNINGSQNGVFLPGNYAVKKIWKGETANPNAEEQEDQEDLPPEYEDECELVGADLDQPPKKVMYVNEVVKNATEYGRTRRGYGGQFHDFHTRYNQFVHEVLDVLYNDLNRKEKRARDECPTCRPRMQQKQVPTPFGLVLRLNVVSSRLEARLKGVKWHPGLYTSKYGQAYIAQLEAEYHARWCSIM